MNEAGAQKAVAKINQAVVEGTSIALKVDVSKEAEVKAMVEKAVDHFGKLDIMFNNAGIMHPEDDNALNTEDRIW